MAQIKMVNGHVITVGVTDHALIAAMLAVPRMPFVPAVSRSFAHSDADLALEEASLPLSSRYLMPPGPFARLVQAARIRREDNVLDVGCATGYSSAVLAHLAGVVVALESDDRLVALAQNTLADLGIDNVTVVSGSLEAGWPAAGPYDVIFIGGSVERIPHAFVPQLKDGGRLVTTVGRGHSGSAFLYVKSGSSFSGRTIFNVAARPLPGFAKPKSFVF